MKIHILYKHSAALLFIAAFFTQTFYKAFVIADYYSNSAAYAKNCENKLRPKMHCNGKCQMMKKILAEEKKGRENSERNSENKNKDGLSSKSFFAASTLPPPSNKTFKPSPHYKSGLCSQRSTAIFHPPQKS